MVPRLGWRSRMMTDGVTAARQCVRQTVKGLAQGDSHLIPEGSLGRLTFLCVKQAQGMCTTMNNQAVSTAVQKRSVATAAVMACGLAHSVDGEDWHSTGRHRREEMMHPVELARGKWISDCGLMLEPLEDQNLNSIINNGLSILWQLAIGSCKLQMYTCTYQIHLCWQYVTYGPRSWMDSDFQKKNKLNFY